MQNDFEQGRSHLPSESAPDTELTLSHTVILLLLVGLVLLCGLCYGLGYTMGRHSAQNLPASSTSTLGDSTVPAADATASSSKPSASAQQAVASPPAASSPAASSVPNDDSAPISDASAARESGSSGSLMVQIAALTHSEDADALVEALHRHGYPVTARREPADGLVHVRVGPFSSRDEASRTRQKLLADGYNAVIQP